MKASSGKVNRRDFILTGSAAGTLALTPVFESWGVTGMHTERGCFRRTISLNQGWLFAGRASARTGDTRTSEVTLPHCVTSLSWQNWDPSSWEDVWLYRRSLEVPPEMHGLRLFLRFDRVMAGATVTINGHVLPQHLGGFLPFEYEITYLAKEKVNTLSIAVDSRWSNVPPAGSSKGPSSIDYLLPGGICGSVALHGVPLAFIKDVFAKPVEVLSRDRRLGITCNIDCRLALPRSAHLTATLRAGERVIAKTTENAEITRSRQDVSFSLGALETVTLWDVENPRLYDLDVTLSLDGSPLHTYMTRVGFREARFEQNGFFLNGRRLQLFGLNRHELYPYVGFAAPPRVLRRDAEYLRGRLNCNMVRCSHYPQSEAFLDACDELGLLVWEEIPGWQYIGDKGWQEIALQNVEDMIRRDRNRPSIVIWGVRINESPNDPELYGRTRELAKSLDDSRPTSGTMTPSSTRDWRERWHEDVFAYDDYHAEADGSVGILDPAPDVPYMIAEAVGQYAYGTGKNFGRRYRRAGDPAEQAVQALLHAQAHSKAAVNSHCCGVIAWCAFDYASLINAHSAVKCPGIADTFRIPKLGASFYLAQVDPSVRAVIEPSFYWDFGPHTPSGPGAHAAIFSNCERLVVLIDGKFHAALTPDRGTFPKLKFAPFFVDLALDGGGNPELRIDGYVAGNRVLSRSFSSDRSTDRLLLEADDASIEADGSDATQVAFAAVDRHGAVRPYVTGEVQLRLTGPGLMIGDNPFLLDESGGVGAVWVKSVADRPGRITVSASHMILGKNTVDVESKKIHAS